MRGHCVHATWMTDVADSAMEGRLREFLEGRVGRRLARREQRESFATYAHEILGDGERKSVEPVGARTTGGRWLPG